MTMKLLAILLLFCPTFVAQELAALAGWIPESNVENESLLDLDQRDIETLLGALTEDSLGLAREIYKNGKNSQGYTIQELSLGSDAYMSRNGTVGEYFATYQKFVDFYGTFDFAHAIISAAFEGNTVELNEHSFYFSAYGVVGRAEFALEMCRRNDTTAAKAGVDRAVAFWIGSLEGTDGAGAGVLSYALAMGRCVDFKTCGDNGDALEGAAAATSKLLESLNSTRASLTIDDCDTATDHVNDAIASMYIPVIQSALLYAHRQDDGNGFETTEKEEGAGAVFASAVLPLVAACNTDDAEIIYETMKNNRDFSVNFSDVKGLFEKNYECLGVTCEDIGGIVRDSARFANANNTGNTTGTVYADGAEPCRNSDIVDKNTTGVPTASPLTTTLPTAERSSMAAPPVAGFIVFPMLFWTCAII